MNTTHFGGDSSGHGSRSRVRWVEGKRGGRYRGKGVVGVVGCVCR